MNLHLQAQGHACQWVVAVQHHMLGVDLGDRVDQLGRHVLGASPFGQAVELHAFLDVFRKHIALLKAHQAWLIVAETVFRLEMKVALEAGCLAGQGFFQFAQQVVAAVEELDRVGQLIERGALCVGQCPGEADDAGFSDQHQGMIAYRPHGKAARCGHPATIWRMDIDQPTPLLGGLSPAQFMRRHWQKKPLLVRQAWPGVRPPIERAALFDLAGVDGVESRLLTQFDGGWRLRHGPFNRRAIPAVKKSHWTLLVQGLDLHQQAAHDMLDPFRFVPGVQLDDLMISYATDGGGVGPHLDSYDVFLLQVHGRRRWRFGPVADRSLVPGLPVRILANFKPEVDVVLEPGDMLYLPPLWGHDGVAEGECMTCSVGFRAATATGLAQELLQGIADDLEAPEPQATGRRAEAIYRDARQPATANPGRIPQSLRSFAQAALEQALRDPQALDRVLGALMTEPKPQVWFDGGVPLSEGLGVALDRRTRMAYDDHHVFINGEAFVASGRDARLMRQLADGRRLMPAEVARLGQDARELLDDWLDAGWAVPTP